MASWLLDMVYIYWPSDKFLLPIRTVGRRQHMPQSWGCLCGLPHAFALLRKSLCIQCAWGLITLPGIRHEASGIGNQESDANLRSTWCIFYKTFEPGTTCGPLDSSTPRSTAHNLTFDVGMWILARPQAPWVKCKSFAAKMFASLASFPITLPLTGFLF